MQVNRSGCLTRHLFTSDEEFVIQNDNKEHLNLGQTQSLFLMVTFKPDSFQEGHQVLPKIFLDTSGAGRGKKRDPWDIPKSLWQFVYIYTHLWEALNVKLI